MKRFLFVSFFVLLFSNVFAAHISGGEMSYIYIGPGTLPGTLKYRVTLKLYRECNAPASAALLDPTAVFTVFNTQTSTLVQNISGIPGSAIQIIQKIPDNPCIDDAIETAVCFQYRTYTTIVDNLPANAMGYTVAYQRCCRIDGMENINSNSVGSTYFAKMPGNINSGAETNTSPVFINSDAILICSGRPVNFDFQATDANDDSLTYQFYIAFSGGSTTNTTPNPAANPPYQGVNYNGPYNFLQPLGPGVTIDIHTGLISGIAPNLGPLANSIFAITVLVNEYRDGIKIGEHFKDLQIRVVDCKTTTALLNPKAAFCKSLDVFFQNDATNNPEPSYYWEFGDPLSGPNNTSTSMTPMHHFTSPGIYKIKLVVDRGGQCGDSTTLDIKVFPGFFPDFTSAGKCINKDIQFTDLSTTNFPPLNSWTWLFGDNSISNTQNPIHIYTTPGTYDVSLIITSTVGCKDTMTKTIEVYDKPPLTVTNDTTICYIDTLQLNAIGIGSFLWSPNYMISGLNIPDPLVSPDVTTKYFVSLTDAFGCVATDSVNVDVKLFVTMFGGNDTTICKTDPVILPLTSDALHYLWTETPAGNTLNDPTLKNPTATPLVTTTYHVTGNIGKCIAQDDIRITPIPYPVANAGPDQTICFGNSAQLQASGGSIYSWNPVAFLTAANVPNPTSVKPTDNVRYVVTVRDVLGCPKPVKDTMMLYVAKIVADAGPKDTSVVIGQPLQLNATGSTDYLWTPGTWLDDPFIRNPISLPQNDIRYVVRVSNFVGCFDTDTIFVKVFKLKPDIYVPTGFAPGGTNKVLRPIAIGMRSVDMFRVYNRWGQLLYSGSGNNAGWDGNFAGKGQESATYVWYAEGVDYLNNKIKKKGYAVLIR